MLKTIISIVIAILLFQFFGFAPIIGQTLNHNSDIAKIKADLTKRGIGEKAKVKIELLDGREVKGYLAELNEDDFVMVEAKTNRRTTIVYSEVRKVKKQGFSPLAILGIAAAVGTGLVIVAAANRTVKCSICP
jgi:hypothetical protein